MAMGNLGLGITWTMNNSSFMPGYSFPGGLFPLSTQSIFTNVLGPLTVSQGLSQASALGHVIGPELAQGDPKAQSLWDKIQNLFGGK